MGTYAYYDAENDVVVCDATDVRGDTTQILDDIFDEIIAILKNLDHKVYVLTCWENASLAPSVVEYYGKRISEVHQHYALGIVRYGMTDVYTRTAIRSQTVFNSLGSSHQYETKEEALEAVRRLRDSGQP